MAEFPGVRTASVLKDDTAAPPRFGNKGAPVITAGSLTDPDAFGGRLASPALVERAFRLTAGRERFYAFLDFYDRIHFSASTLNLGNVASSQVRTFRVFNGWLDQSRTLNSVTPANDAGLALTQPGLPPLVYGPMQERTYTLNVDDNGPATIDATYAFSFDSVNFTLAVKGVRIVAWHWEPDWADPVIERLQWNTDVLVAQDSTEQRVALTQGARWSYSFRVREQAQQARTLLSTLYGWGSRIFALPVWPDAVVLTGGLAPGATSIPVTDTTGRDFGVGRLCVFLADDGSFEAVEVTSVSGNAIGVTPPTLNPYAQGTRLYPARTARLRAAETVEALTSDALQLAVVMTTTESCQRPAAVEATYRTYPVMTEPPNWRDAPAVEFERKQDVFDTGVARPVVVDESGLPAMVHRYQWTAGSRAEVNALRAFLYARQGRLRGVWVPTWRRDLELVATVSSSATQIDVEHAALTQFVAAGVNRRDLRVELNSGAVFYRRASGFVEVTASTERMTIDTAFGITVAPADVRRISFMSLCRLDADAVEVAWPHVEAAEAQIPLRSYRSAL